MPKFSPCLWFDTQAEEAANFYTTIFEKGAILSKTNYVNEEHQPQGTSLMTIEFTLANQKIIGLNGGPEFSFTPASSFFVECKTLSQTETLWKNLTADGQILMPFGEYPFSPLYGWVVDKFGVSWQVSFSGKEQTIVPTFMFANEKYGEAAKALSEWLAIFGPGEIIEKVEYEDGNIAQALFTLQEQPFRVMDARDKHDFDFTMAFSIYIDCENQEEIDRLWQQVTAKGKEWPCGWMEDQFGVSWQTDNPELKRYLSDSNPARANEVTKKLYQMKKIDLNQLKEVYDKYNH
ncbi:VOC family protein [Enterococcus faecalis]|uniref:VOC family protein n=1 Tax=Enterococcus faecalis TaxID=1351 RepID=UPI0015614219|nr:VOC family protein [Enterococcus faecalis]NRE13522.1 hypothetical protein [Enterococcus faecalis]NRE20879.1 hypothetical protein [Enterococcus faecalis]NRE41587.1 hypothetical protein [Enterococcus faecalis]